MGGHPGRDRRAVTVARSSSRAGHRPGGAGKPPSSISGTWSGAERGHHLRLFGGAVVGLVVGFGAMVLVGARICPATSPGVARCRLGLRAAAGHHAAAHPRHRVRSTCPLGRRGGLGARCWRPGRPSSAVPRPLAGRLPAAAPLGGAVSHPYQVEWRWVSMGPLWLLLRPRDVGLLARRTAPALRPPPRRAVVPVAVVVGGSALAAAAPLPAAVLLVGPYLPSRSPPGVPSYWGGAPAGGDDVAVAWLPDAPWIRLPYRPRPSPRSAPTPTWQPRSWAPSRPITARVACRGSPRVSGVAETRTAKAELTRAGIVDAALRLFRSSGYDAATIARSPTRRVSRWAAPTTTSPARKLVQAFYDQLQVEHAAAARGGDTTRRCSPTGSAG